MKIYVKENERRLPLVLFFPLFFFKTGFVSRAIAKYAELDIDPKELKTNIRVAYKGLKAFIKENGHFNLVEVRQKDGGIILIKV
ncbi:MAG: hypothetical protein K6B65_07280 [Bacilli bacterium]|nr:hypothetical protein [Bacilli bacterium]